MKTGNVVWKQNNGTLQPTLVTHQFIITYNDQIFVREKSTGNIIWSALVQKKCSPTL